MTRQDVESTLGKPDRLSIGNSATSDRYDTLRGRSANLEIDEKGCAKGKSQIPDGKKPALNAGFLLYGALDRIRTCDRSVRSRVLYPAELRVQFVFLDQITTG